MPTAPNIYRDMLVEIPDLDAFMTWARDKGWPGVDADGFTPAVGIQQVGAGKARLCAMRMLKELVDPLSSAPVTILKVVDPYADVFDIEDDVEAIQARRSLFDSVKTDASVVAEIREYVPETKEVTTDAGKETVSQSIAFADFGDGYKLQLDKEI